MVKSPLVHSECPAVEPVAATWLWLLLLSNALWQMTQPLDVIIATRGMLGQTRAGPNCDSDFGLDPDLGTALPAEVPAGHPFIGELLCLL